MIVSPRLALSLVLGSLAAAGCGANPSVSAGTRVDPATAGSITGSVVFTGTPPPLEMLRMAIDPVCLQLAGPVPESDAVLLGPEGALQNAFVYIKSGLDPKYAFELPAAPAQLDQRSCRFVPRVLGVRVGQPLEFINSDFTAHNVHARPTINREFNRHQPQQGMRESRTFTRPEVMVPIRCDLHPWMVAHVGVVEHPYFLVTGEDGSFTLEGVPPGTYTLEAWHERLGTRTADVTVGPRGRASVTFDFMAE
jgi:plastocyanin